MTQHVPLADEDQVPEEFFDAVQEMLSGAAINFLLRQVTANQIRVSAGSGDDQVSLAIDGAYRWNTADITLTHPGGGAGTYTVWATALANQVPPLFGPAGGDHSFGLAITNGSNPAGAAIFRKVGLLAWSGSAIRQLNTIVGGGGSSSASDDGILVGVVLDWPGEGDPIDPRYLAAEGRLVNSADYPEYDALVGNSAPVGQKHKFNGGVDPGGGKFRISDGRGRNRVGADNLGTAQGAAGRLTTAAGHVNAVGQGGGEERHTLVWAELPSGAPTLHTATGATGGLSGPLGGTIGGGGGDMGGINWAGASSPVNVLSPYEVYTPIVRVK